uniref:Uncharacterized protein n=1 Tax=Arundo donax TaxID=35708 RepID=A0A0A9AYE6_ARUDO
MNQEKKLSQGENA